MDQYFKLVLAMNIQVDEINSMDITWFTLVGQCDTCGQAQELFTDETA